MNWARHTTNSNALVDRVRPKVVAFNEFTWCILRRRYPGTREGFILVVDITPNGHDASGLRRREELADFLRNRRASVKPEDVGLPNGGRRRTPGLRREEVAQLAGVGATWYTWLEQGRDVRASLDVLEAIARALRLTPAERTHLILLGRGEEAPPCKPPAERVSPTIRRLIENLRTAPAFVLGRRWDYLAWNSAACALLGDFDKIPRAARNHLWLTFMDPARRILFPDWERTARMAAAKFRADSAAHIGDPSFDELIQALRQSSPEFCKAWKRHEVERSGEGRKEINHPIEGKLVFEHAVFHPSEAPEQRLVLYTPVPEHDTTAKLARLLDQAPAEVALAR
jgi:transcriptional regulator with XRE-family HTH domain